MVLFCQGAGLAKLQRRAPFLGKEAESEEASRGGEEEEEVSSQSILFHLGHFVGLILCCFTPRHDFKGGTEGNIEEWTDSCRLPRATGSDQPLPHSDVILIDQLRRRG